MKGRFFLDTNIFLYSFDASSTKKSAKARKLIRSAIETRGGIVSYQVVQEFFNVALRRLASIRSHIRKHRVPYVGSCQMLDIGMEEVQMFVSSVGLSAKLKRTFMPLCRCFGNRRAREVIHSAARAWGICSS
jgi:predicted nucleic acid-binding protein